MDFLKRWWVWLLFLVLALSIGVFQMVVVEQYKEEARQVTAAVLENKGKLDSNRRKAQNKTLHTESDVKVQNEHYSAIKAEGFATLGAWIAASQGLSEKCPLADIDKFSYWLNDEGKAIHLKLCNKLKRWVALPAEFALVETGKVFRNTEETVPYWRRFLIAKRIAEVVGETGATVSAFAVVRDDDEGGKPLKPGTFVESKLIPAEEWRAVERLGKINFGAMIPATHGVTEKGFELLQKGNKQGGGAPETAAPPPPMPDQGMPGMPGGMPGMPPAPSSAPSQASAAVVQANKVACYDTYPVDFEVVAHVRVVHELVRNLVKTPGLIFIPGTVSIASFKDSEIVPLDEKKRNELLESFAISSENDAKPVPPEKIEIYKAMEYGHEPPVMAKLHFEVYHFNITMPADKNEAAGAAKGK